MIRVHQICKEGLLLILLLQGVYTFSQSFAPGQKTNKNGLRLSGTEDPGDRPVNNAFINFLGDGSLASLNYERLFLIDPEHAFITGGLGLGMNSLVTIHANEHASYTSDNFPVIPHHISGNIGNGRHFLELGLGGTILANGGGQHYLTYLMVGYRLQPLNTNRVSARLFGSYPLQRLEKFDMIYVPVGISVGWSF